MLRLLLAHALSRLSACQRLAHMLNCWVLVVAAAAGGHACSGGGTQVGAVRQRHVLLQLPYGQRTGTCICCGCMCSGSMQWPS
jgi:hypothetical protein